MARSGILVGNGTIDTATRLLLRGPDIDPAGLPVRAATSSFFDYTNFGGTVAENMSLPNLWPTGEAAIVKFSAPDAQANKGVYKQGASGTPHLMKIGSAFDLNSYGAGASVVLSSWITHKSFIANADAIIGYAFANASYNQWSISVDGDLSSVRLRINSNDASVPTALDEPILYTVYVEAISASSYVAKFYHNESVKLTTPISTYPFNDPTSAGGNQVPGFGMLNGYSQTYSGIFQRAQAFEVNPKVFDIDAWLSAEIATNATRLA